jgi:hypothetical protein
MNDWIENLDKQIYCILGIFCFLLLCTCSVSMQPFHIRNKVWLYCNCFHITLPVSCMCNPHGCVLLCRERAALARANRKMDKRLKELQIQAEDERRNADQYKEQVSFFLIVETTLW